MRPFAPRSTTNAGARAGDGAPRAPRRRVVRAADLTIANPDHDYAKETLRGVFARLLRGLDARLVLTPT